MIRGWKKIILSFLGSLLLVLVFLTCTTAGLKTLISIGQWFTSGKIHIDHIQGRLISQLKFKNFLYEDKYTRLSIKHLDFQWRPSALFFKTLKIEKLVIDDTQITLSPVPAKAKPVKAAHSKVWEPPKLQFKLPIALSINQLQINQLKVIYNKQAHQLNNLKLSIDINNQLIKLTELDLQFADHVIEGKGELSLSQPYQGRISIVDKKDLDFGLSIEGKGAIIELHSRLGRLANIKINGQIQNLFQSGNSNLSVNFSGLDWPLDAKSSITNIQGIWLIKGNQNNYQLKLNGGLTHPDLHTINYQVQVNGSAKTIELKQSKISVANGEIDAHAILQFKPKLFWHAEIQTRQLSLTDILPYPLEGLNLKLQLTGDKALQNASLSQLQGRYGSQSIGGKVSLKKGKQINGQIHLGNNQIRITGNWPKILQLHLNLDAPNQFSPSLSGLQTKLKGSLNIKKRHQGEMTLTLSPGYFILANGSQIDFQGGQVQSSFTKTKYNLTGKLNLNAHNYLTTKIKVNAYKNGYNMHSRINIQMLDLSFINSFSDLIEKAQGRLAGSIELTGDIFNPNVKTQFSLTGGSLDVPTIGLQLTPITLQASGRNQQLNFTGSIATQGNHLSLSGSSKLNPLSANIQLSGQGFPVVNLPEVKIAISPNIKTTYQNGHTHVSGEILIPSADIAPVNWSSSVTTPSDFIIVKPNQEIAQRKSRVDYQLKLKLGQSVELNMYGLTGKLQGDLAFGGHSNAPLRGVGNLNIIDGKYQAYGQNLTISKGQLLFTGGLISNPGVNLTAIRTFNNSSLDSADFSSANAGGLSSTFDNRLTVGIRATGQIRHPKVVLFSSSSSLSQSDILSMLVLGRPSGQIGTSGGAADGQMLVGALSSMSLGSSSANNLFSNLEHAIGLDNLGIEKVSHYDEDSGTVSNSNVFVLRKNISPKLTMQYGFGFGDSSYLIRFRYLLTKTWSLQVESSANGNGADILYHYTRN